MPGFDPLGGFRGDGRGQNQTLLDYYVAHQIKGNDTYSKMVANIVPSDTPLTPGVGSKGQTFFFLK